MSENLTALGELTADQQALLLLLLQKKAKARAEQQIPRVSSSGRQPLSFAQERLWFIDQFEPNTPTYNIPGGVRLIGALRFAALEQSINELVRRHEALRTSFVDSNGQPAQQITRELKLQLPLVDLRGLSVDKQQQQAERLRREEARRPFDLSYAPLLRVQLVQLSDARYEFLFTMHHIVSDGWSMTVMVREIGVLYHGGLWGEPSGLPELEIQYSDFAMWQRERLQGEVLDNELRYWKQQLADAAKVLDLPADRARPRLGSSRGGHLSFVLNESVSNGLRELSQRSNTTLFMTLLAGFKALLYRYTKQTDILVGTPIANRNRLQIEPLIGFFVNTLVLRTQLQPALSFRELLQQVRETVVGAQAHQELPFERLVQELAPERNLSHAPLFQVTMSLDNTPPRRLELPELELQAIGADLATAKFDLILALSTNREDGQLAGAIEYNTDLFDHSRIERLAEHFNLLLTAVVEDAEQPIARLELLSAAERHRLLVEWNDTDAVDLPESYLHESLAAQAQLTPEAIAVGFEDDALTYAELNARSNQLAHYLRRLGVGPDVLVGLCLEPSLDLVIGMFGILKAGGAYVPLDPAYPAERLSFIVADAQAPMIVTSERLASALPAGEIEVVCLDRDWSSIARESERDCDSGVSADNPAYVIYTSGSTGRPKGVAIPHKAIRNHMQWMQAEYPLGPEDRVYQKTSFGFDASVWEFYAPLLAGGQFVMAAPGEHRDPSAMITRVQSQQVTILQMVPSVLEEMVRDTAFAACHSLRRLFCGGEVLETALVRKVLNVLPAVEVVNLYGPTEACIDTVTARTAGEETNHVAIGRPVTNVQAYVLDENLTLVPSGVPGELYLGGIALARGYVRRPDLTAERFIPNPFGSAGERLYRTGDLTRHLVDGRLEYLSRSDHQVKVRGYRIELGEIEAVLRVHPSVAEVIVVARDAESGAKQLVAYLVGHGSTHRELSEYLRAKLPQYMVPQAFVWLEEFPRLPNGKVNRQLLPEPERSEGSERSDREPETQIEQIVAGVWCEVLGLDQVGVEENFFELGGHSLLAVQIASRVRTALEFELPLRWVFESPTVAGLSERIEAARQSAAGLSVPPITPVLREELSPLSFAQERLWFIDQLQPESAAYNIPSGVQLTGSLRISALEQSVFELVRRHEMLRTSFVDVAGQPVQQIAAELQLELPLVDLGSLSASEQEQQAERLRREEVRRPFALRCAPLLRVRLLQLNEQQHQFLFTMHHIVSDGWSMNVAVRELVTLYEALHAGQPSPLPELAVQYADFAVWQREWQQETILTQLDYWKEQLAGAPEVLELPTDRTRPLLPSYNGAHESFSLPASLHQELKRLSRKHDATLFMTLLAAFQTLLYRYTGQTDILIGTPVANRNRVEIEPLIGFFVNTLVLRTRLNDESSFHSLLQQTREVVLGAQAHQELPFERLVQELAPERSLSHAPLFQVMLMLDNTPPRRLELPALELQAIGADSATAKFDLMLALSTKGESGELRGVIEYSTDLFDSDRMARLVEHFSVLLTAAVTDTEQRLADLPLLSETERHRLLVEWNDTYAERPASYVHELLVEQAQLRPEALAVEFEDVSLTYAELNARANQLGHYLRRLGVGPDVLVGLCLEPSLEMVIGLLGILKAGGAYVPLDPGYPAERLSFMVADSRAQVIVTREQYQELAADTETVCLDRDWSLIAREQGGDSESVVCAENLAYVIYTSGSTGRPKGVMIEHGGLRNYLQWARQTYPVTEGFAVPVQSSLSFDLTVTSLLLPLVSGQRVVLLSEAEGAGALGHAVAQESNWSLVKLTPANLELLSHQLPGAQAAGRVRMFVVGGEALRWEQLRYWQTYAPDTRIVNEYGPTETVVGCCVYEADGGGRESDVPIGRAIGNTRLYVLSGGMQPAPIGVSGELGISGAGVARGYLERPELTAGMFVPDPFSAEPGGRLYRTGDVARYRADGVLEYLGRNDQQVKIRGYRIETGEIEAALVQCGGVRHAVVQLREDTAGDKRLVAYVVPEAEVSETLIDELRRGLQSGLPDYMVPSAFVWLEELPLDANGKVNRKALPAPESTGTSIGYVAPRTATEQLVAEIWAEVLKVQEVGVEDNFFSLGGHSLLAAQVISRLRTACQVELPLRAMFEAGTVAALAELIEDETQQHRHALLPPLISVDREGSLPLSFAQERLWFLNQLEPQSAFYNIPIALRLRGPLNIAALESTLNEMMRRHEVLRTTFTDAGGKPEQLISAARPRPLRVIDLIGLKPQQREAAVQNAIKEDARTPFDLVLGPLVRQQLLRVDEAEHVVLLTMHHIVSDGWSMGVLVNEVAGLYETYRRGKSSPLPELEIQYADFAVWQREWLQGEVLEDELTYWKQQLADAPEVLELPTDRLRPRLESFRGAYQSLVLNEDVARRLTQVGQQHGTTLFMTLLAAFQTVLYRYTGQTNILVGTPVANRNRLEIEPLIGFFVNTLVLRAQLNGEASFRELLKQTREVVLGAQAHQELPFERLVQELAPERSLSHAPLFQVMLTLDNTPPRRLELPALELQAIGADNATAKFDLNLSLSTNRESGELNGVLKYNTALFDSDRMARLVEHFSVLLTAAVTDTEQRLADLPLLSETERHQLLVEWNDTYAERPASYVHELLVEQVQLRPEALAVEFEDVSLTYAELNARANQLGHYLRRLGVGPDVLVGLCLEPSLEMVIGLLGILKAGGAYVPLDPGYPAERLSFMVADSRAQVIVTREQYQELAADTETVCLDRDWSLIAREQGGDSESVVCAENLAYVIYTSGSTGRPKGVMIEHGGLRNYLQWARQTYPVTEGFAVPVQSSLSFDLTVTSLLLPLVSGQRVVLLSEVEGAGALGHAVAQETDWSLVKLTPANLELLSHQLPGAHAAGRVRMFVVGGEALRWEQLRYWQTYAPDTRIVNEYGPTETVVGCCVYEADGGGRESDVPIGRAIGNTRLYVLSGGMQPAPIGVSGELGISGAGVARGYLERPELTAGMFVPDPFSAEPGGRLYRTGDVARYRADGVLEYLGRNDQQVKIRGYRIETGEIEAALVQCGGVRHAVVQLREDTAGDKRLVAYVVPEAEVSETLIDELRRGLQSGLPDYMVPSAFVWLEELPLDANGKVNRKALPAPESTGTSIGYVAPRTATEQLVAEIWAEVLKVQEVGVEDNFFSLGGHSLLAAQVISRLRTACQVELPLRAMFEAGTVAALAELIEDETLQHRRALLPPLISVNREGTLPLSFAQERLWFIDQLDEGSAVYNMSTAVKLEGSLHTAALEQSLAEVVRRHEILRTSFVEIDGQPAQVAAATCDVPLHIANLNQIVSADPAEVIAQETATVFDLTCPPLLRARLVQLNDREHALVVTFHHIISDGWSMGLFVRELMALYNAFSSGKPSPLPELSLQYADYAAWQRRWLQGEILGQQLDYWKQQLKDVPDLLELPLDHPRTQIRRYRGALESRQLSPELSEALRTLSQRNGTTLFMTLLAAFQVMLSRYSGQEDIVVGAPSAGRHLTELEEQIGFFLNTLALRTDLSGNPSFIELLTRVRKLSLEAFAHQDAPFEKLLEELQLQRDLSRTPLIQVFFNMLNLPTQSAELPQLRITPLSQEAGAKFDLTLYVGERRDGLRFALVYDADLFEPARMSEMLEQYECLLEQIATEPKRTISEFSLVTSSSRAVLPDATVVLPEPVHEPITQTFFGVAERYAGHEAISAEQQSWNYFDLSQRAKAIAQFLLDDGLRKGDVVAVSGAPSFDLIASLLGVMAAGGVILPLDPNLPEGRRELMVCEADVNRLLLTDELPQMPTTVVKEKRPRIDPGDPAYIFFTSGSTGVPKAVLGCHKGLAHFLKWQRSTFRIGPGDRCAQLTALSFDVVMRDIFLGLTSGASLHLPGNQDSILSWLERERITVIHSVPSLVQSWLNDVPTDVTLSSLRYAFLAGEPLADSLVRRWRNQFPESGSIVNLYGPTETTLAKCFYIVPEEPSFGVQPVGTPLPETQALVVNNSGGLCGIGERGEISIRTPFRTLGYLNQSVENEKRFVPNPLVHDERDVIYKTGDLGRYRLDGSVEIVGRVDDQIKIRGVRIEPNEVTAVLLQHAAVQSGAVIGYKDEDGHAALVAYVVASEGKQILPELRAFLSGQLPAAMMPSSFILIDELPLTANGKLDRRRLPAPDFTTVQIEQVPPRSWTEEVVGGIWAEVLRRDRIGVHDDFFELGGHSLLATQVIARVRHAFHVELPLRRLFERPTVALLAETIDEGIRGHAESAVPAMQPARRDAPLPLSFAQERLWFLHQLQPESFAYNMTAWIDLTGVLNTVALDQATNEIVRRHEILRSSFATSDGQPVQVVAAPPQQLLTIVDLSRLSNDEQESQAQSLSRQLTHRPFDLAQGPVMRGTLLRLDEEHHSMLLGIHHIAADAWSTTIFIHEVGTLYGSFLKGEHSQLPELAIQYVDFAAWQRGWLQGEVLDKQLAYWKEQLRNSPPMLELPTDRARPPIQTVRGQVARLNVAEDLTSRLVSLSRRNGATLFMTVMAVFKTLLHRYTGSEDIVVGTGIAERKSVELEKMIGLFINQLAIRTQPSERQSFIELLQAVRDTSLAAYAHQDLPFEKLVAELQPERSLSRTPLFQVMLMMQTAPVTRSGLTAITARRRTQANGGAKFDLTMHIVPTTSELRIILEYNTVLFDANRVHRLLGHFHSLLEHVVTHPEQRLGELQLLTVDERSQLLVEWNNTDTSHQRDICIHGLVEAQAEQTPDRIAIEFNGATLTYRELNSRANQLAHFLKALHVGSEVMVSVCLERSLEMIVAMLGTLKAGGAYVPLDPAYPAERIEFMLDDTQAPVLLTQARLAEQKDFGKRDARVICLDRDWSQIAERSSQNISAGHGPDNLGYVIYTSGSTGRPKGVAIQHSSAVALIAWANGVFSPEEFKGVLASTSICFDLSIFEIFVPLSSGGRVIIVADALRLPALESAAAVTLLNTVPSAAAELLRSDGLPKTLQTVNLAGEPLSTSLVRQLYDYGSIERVFDLYGPTEDTTYSTFALRAGTGQATIGRPVSNTKTYVLDKNLQPVPVGVPGELYLGGEGLARGYLNRPELTATRFIPNPFTAGRLYKTGDLVRYLDDGRLEYLGRTDHQIKLRGFRIELGEVEAVLRTHPQIRENIVLVREDEPGDRRLTAYLVTNEEIPIGDLRVFLRKKLPDYMIPSAFVRLDALPLTANGKVDRKALPQPDDPSSRARNNYVAPRAELERTLVKIWQELLRVETVGVEDNFFDLGGHSLLLLRMVQEIQNALGLEIALLEMFEHPTVSSLARHLSSKQDAENKVTPTSESTPADADGRRRRRMKRQKASTNNLE